MASLDRRSSNWEYLWNFFSLSYKSGHILCAMHVLYMYVHGSMYSTYLIRTTTRPPYVPIERLAHEKTPEKTLKNRGQENTNLQRLNLTNPHNICSNPRPPPLHNNIILDQHAARPKALARLAGWVLRVVFQAYK